MAPELTSEEKFRLLIEAKTLLSRPTTAQIARDERSQSPSTLPASLLQHTLAEEILPIPLPFGRIENRIIIPHERLLFHVELPSYHTLLTVEIDCVMGGVEVLISCDAPPTLEKYDYRGHCPTPSPSDSKRLRMTIPLASNFQENKSCPSIPYLILIIGDPTGAEFTIWTKASCPSFEREDIVNKVKALQLLSEYGPRNLVNNFEKLHSETIKMVSHRSTPIDGLRSSSDRKIIKGDFDSDSDDDASMFLRKSGVFVLKKETEGGQEGIDPNFSVELFDKDVLKGNVHGYFEALLQDTDTIQLKESIGDPAKLVSSLKESQAYKSALNSLSLRTGKLRSSVGTHKRKTHRLEPLKYTLTVPTKGSDRHRKKFV